MKKKNSKSVSKSSSKSKIIPLADRVLVRPFSTEEVEGKKNSFGIIIPDTVSKEKSAQGKVLAVGDTKKVKIGDIVIFSRYSYDEVEHDGEELYLIKEENIFAVIK